MRVATLTNNGSVKYRNEEIVAKAYSCLESHPHFRGRTINIHICYEESALRLEGRLPTYFLKQILQTALQGVSGVQQIQNDVEVFNPSRPANGRNSLN